jgi:hypothetical protein
MKLCLSMSSLVHNAIFLLRSSENQNINIILAAMYQLILNWPSHCALFFSLSTSGGHPTLLQLELTGKSIIPII